MLSRRDLLRRALGLGAGLVVAHTLVEAEALAAPARRFWQLDGTMGVPRAQRRPGAFTLEIGTADGWREVGRVVTVEGGFQPWDDPTGILLYHGLTGGPRVYDGWLDRNGLHRGPLPPERLVREGKVTHGLVDPALVSEVARYGHSRSRAGEVRDAPLGAGRHDAGHARPAANRRA